MSKIEGARPRHHVPLYDFSGGEARPAEPIDPNKKPWIVWAERSYDTSVTNVLALTIEDAVRYCADYAYANGLDRRQVDVLWCACLDEWTTDEMRDQQPHPPTDGVLYFHTRGGPPVSVTSAQKPADPRDVWPPDAARAQDLTVVMSRDVADHLGIVPEDDPPYIAALDVLEAEFGVFLFIGRMGDKDPHPHRFDSTIAPNDTCLDCGLVIRSPLNNCKGKREYAVISRVDRDDGKIDGRMRQALLKWLADDERKWSDG